MPKNQPIYSGFSPAALNIYDKSLIPLAVIDSSLKVIYKNKAFTELFGIRKGASIKHITKAGSSAEQVFDNIADFEIPVLSETGNFRFNVTLITIPLREFFNDDLFLLLTADAKLLMQVSLGMGNEFDLNDNILNISAVELKSIYSKYINPYICHVISTGSIENIINKQDRQKLVGKIMQLKKLEIFMYSELQRSMRISKEIRPEYVAVNVNSVFRRLSELVSEHAPRGYSVVFEIDEGITTIAAKNGHELTGLLMCAINFIFKLRGDNSVTLSMKDLKDCMVLEIAPSGKAALGQESSVIIENFRRTIAERDIEFMEYFAKLLEAQFTFDAQQASISLTFDKSAAKTKDLVLYDSIVTAKQQKMAQEMSEIFALMLSLYKYNSDSDEI